MLSPSAFRQLLSLNRQFVRRKHGPDHWSVVRKKNHPVDKALAHFDEFYQQVFTSKWESIREGLLGKQKYVAIINNYSDSEQVISKLELNGAINVRTLFNLQKDEIKARHLRKMRQKAIETAQAAAEVEPVPGNVSLQKSLETAEIDTRRFIDSKLSAEILHEFVPATKIKGKDEFVSESSHYEFYQTSSKFAVEIVREYDWEFPEHLNVYCFEEGNHGDFEPAVNGSTGVLGYYLMDGGSVLPVLALGIRPGDRVLDMCAAPGGKTLLAIQTLYPNCVVCNDISISRTNRIYGVCKQFLYDLEERWMKPGRLKITNIDGRRISGEEFDRILVDVPCTTDRHSLHVNENNIFRPSRVRERLKLPEMQAELLVSALKLVRVGGTVVYSTCSLSPIQNDGVVHMALKQIWEETKLEIVVKDLSAALLQARHVYKLADGKLMRYGHLVVPNLDQNYGPMYFCKLERVK